MYFIPQDVTAQFLCHNTKYSFNIFCLIYLYKTTLTSKYTAVLLLIIKPQTLRAESNLRAKSSSLKSSEN